MSSIGLECSIVNEWSSINDGDSWLLGSSESDDVPGGVTVGVLTMELVMWCDVMLVHYRHNCCTCRLTVLSSWIRKLHAGQGRCCSHPFSSWLRHPLATMIVRKRCESIHHIKVLSDKTYLLYLLQIRSKLCNYWYTHKLLSCGWWYTTTIVEWKYKGVSPRRRGIRPHNLVYVCVHACMHT